MEPPGVREILLDHRQIEGLSRRPVGESEGVTQAILWGHEHSYAGVMWVEPGASIPEHVHSQHVHHLWVIEGQAEVLGRVLDERSYWFIPQGRPHALRGVSPTGCTLFYLYV